VKEGTGGSLDDSIFCQVAELHVTEGFPWADHGDVCAKTLHAGDVISESDDWIKETLLHASKKGIRALKSRSTK